MKGTSETVFTTTFDNDGLTEVYSSATYSPALGWNTHTFTIPFSWNGTSNIIIDVCLGNTSGCTYNPSVYYTSTSSYYRTRYYRSDDYIACGTTSSATRSYYRANMQITWMPSTSPILNVNPGSLDFGSVLSGSYSGEKSYVLSGTNLTAGPIAVTAPIGYEISLTTGGPYTQSVNVTYTPPTLANTTIYARFHPTSPNTVYNYNITNSGGGATTANVACTGSSPCDPLTLPVTEGFNSSTMPSCWSQQFVTGTLAFTFPTTGTGTPAPTPFEGTNQVMFNSYSYSSKTRLVSAPVITTGISSVDVTFYWYNSTNGGSSYYQTEGVSVQWSLDGTTWTTVGSQFLRYNAVDGWVKKSVTLPADAGNKSKIHIGFLFEGNGGYDCYLDKARIISTPTCFEPTTFSMSAITSTSATVTWGVPFPAPEKGYDIYYSSSSTPPTSLTTPSASVSASQLSYNITGLSGGTVYYVWVRSKCQAGESEWGGPTTFTTLCPVPANQPTALILTPTLTTQIDGSFTPVVGTPPPDGYLVVRYPQGAAVTPPVDGTTYSAGNALGLGTVVSSAASPTVTFTSTGLTATTAYTFYVYSMNNLCIGNGRSYLTLSPLSGTATTLSPTLPLCATTFTPLNAATAIPPTQVLSWSGATGDPVVTGYDVYLSTNQTLVANHDPSVKVSSNQATTTFTPSPTLNLSTTYYWSVVPKNSVGDATGCAVNSFVTTVPGDKTSTALGGLWSNPQTWVGGVVPVIYDNVTIADGAIVTIDAALPTQFNNLTIGQGASGILQWGSTSYSLTVGGNLTIMPGGSLLAYSTTPTGQTINVGGNFTNNGFVNLAVASTLLNFNGSQLTGGSLAQTLGGTGTFVGDGTNGIIRSLAFQTTGSSVISTTQNLIVTTIFTHTAGSLNTNGKLSIDNTAQVYGQPLNSRVANVVVSNMGTGITTAPVIFGASATAWTASGAATINSRYYSGINVYICSTAGTFGSTAPSHTSGTASNGTATLLWLGPLGTIGNPFPLTAVTLGTQYFYGANLYVCSQAGTPSAAAPPVHTSGEATSGGAKFIYSGTAAMVSVNYDATTSKLRSLSLTNPGSGYILSSPTIVVIYPGAGSGAVASAVQLQSILGPASSLTQKSPVAVISGGLNILSSQGVGGVTTTSGGIYTATPSIGFPLPSGFLNLVTNGGSGYTTAPTVVVSGGTYLTGVTSPTFTINVAQGKVTSVYCSAGGTLWTSIPTLTLTGGGGTGATAAFPAGCLATANVTVANNSITNFTVINAGFGYSSAPTPALAGGIVVLAATSPTSRIGIYNLTYNYFAPAATNPASFAGAEIPANNRINVLTMGSSTSAATFANITLNSNLELYASSGALVFPGSTSVGNSLNLNANTLTFSHYSYTGTTGSPTLGSVTNGNIILTLQGASTTARNFPFDATFTVTPGTGNSLTTLNVSRTAAPTGTGAIGTRGYYLVSNPGASYGTTSSPTVTMNWNSNDGIITQTTAPGLLIAQASVNSGPWTIRSASSGTGFLGTTGSRTTATLVPGPIVLTGNDYFAWNSTSGFPSALSYTVTRTKANPYVSIMPVALGGNGTGLAFTYATASGDEAVSNVVNIVSSTLQFQGSTVTGFRIGTNGIMSLVNSFGGDVGTWTYNNQLITITGRNVLAPFFEDLTNSAAQGGSGGSSQSQLDNTMRYYISPDPPGSRTITVEWYNMTFYAKTGPELYFQVVLDENDNSITYRYGNMQLYNGTQDIRWSYTCGMSGAFVSNPPLPGQIFIQQYENTTAFDYVNSLAPSIGANGLGIAPEPRSSIKFTPGTYAGYSPPVSVPPVNDDVAGAVILPALNNFPTNIAWNPVSNSSNLFTTRYATTSPQPICGGSSTAKDVWFKFNATIPDITVRIYGSGGFIPRLQILDASLNPLPSPQCILGTQGFTAQASMIGLTVGADYYVRVYHNQTGVTATATANLTSGSVSSITMVNNGSGYTVCPSSFSYTNNNLTARVSFTGGGGSNAAAYATMSGGAITSITVGTGGGGGSGSNYSSAPTVNIESPDWGITGEFGIIIFAAAANDECSGATLLSNLSNSGCIDGQNSKTGVYTGAATASPEPSCSGTPDMDVWYKFVATSTITNVTVNGNGVFNPAVEIWDGGNPGSCGSKTSIQCLNATGAGGYEAIDLATTVGNTYYIRVYNWSGGNGSFSSFDICVRNVVAPSNDDPCGAVTLDVNNTCSSYSDISYPSTTSFFGASTTISNGVVAPNCSGTTTPVKDVWFKFVAPFTGAVSLSVTPTASVTPAVQLYSVTSGTCGGSNLIISPFGCLYGTSGTSLLVSVTNMTPGDTYYIRLYNYPSGQGRTTPNNSQFTICLAVKCPEPSSLTATNMTFSSADLGWTPNGGSQWEIDWALSDVPLGLGTQLTGITSNPYTLNGLSPATTYRYYIRTNCGSGGTSDWVGPYTFSTPCTDVTLFPYQQSFDGSTFVPNCWSLVGTSNWARSTSGSYPSCTPHTGQGMAYFNSFSFSSGTTSQMITPPFALPQDGFVVSFWMYRDPGYASYADRVNVYFNTSAGISGAQLLGTINRSTSLTPVISSGIAGWYMYTMTLPSGSIGVARYVIFEAVSDNGNNIFLDDVYIGPPPMSYVSGTITHNSAGTIPGAANQMIVRLEVVTANYLFPLSMTSLTGTATGTTLVSDISNAKVFYTGATPLFSTSNQFGSTITSPTIENFVFNGTQTLLSGSNFFWLTYDITPGATIGNVVAANIPSISLNLEIKNPTDGTPGSRPIIMPLSGTITVGTGGTYPTLTNDGGLFQAINNAGLAGDLVVNVVSDISTENGTHALNQWSEAGAGNYTLKIQPASASLKTISGSYAGGLFRLYGADRTTFSGAYSDDETQYLAFVNNNTSATSAMFWLGSSPQSGAVDNTIKSCIISGNSGTTTLYGIVSSSGTTMGGPAEVANNNNTFLSNKIIKSQYGIAVYGANGNDQGLSISTNTIGSVVESEKLSVNGILLNGQQNATVSDNIISCVVSTLNTPVYGIRLTGAANTILITRNKISGVKNTNPGGYTAIGLALESSSSAAGVTVSNNLIFDITGCGFNSLTTDNGYGINIASGGGYNLWFNSVNMATNQLNATGKPACLIIGSSPTIPAGGLDIRNNIFSIPATVGAERYAVISNAASSKFASINYNDYYTSGGNLGYIGAANRANLAAWQTGTGQDAASVSVDPAFVSPVNLHTLVPALNNSGVTIAAVPNDFDLIARTNPPDIGAYEFTLPITAINTLAATNIYQTTVDLHGNINTNGEKVNVFFEYGLNTGYGNTTDAVPASVRSFVLTPFDKSMAGLLPSTTYHYRAKGVSTTSGEVIYGQDLTFTTLDLPTIQGPNNVCEGATQNVYFTETGKYDYTWTVLGGTITAGGTPTDNTVTVTWPTAGTQTVTVNYRSTPAGPFAPTATVYPVEVNPNLPVSVTIVASDNPVCTGAPVTFTATPVNGGLNPTYQWKVNGMDAGVNTPAYTYVPLNGDVITCVLTSDIPCPMGNPATSNEITMTVTPPYLPVSVTIVPSANDVCLGSPVTFTATPVNGGLTPIYEWKVNDVTVGTNSPTYTYVPVNNDAVICILTTSDYCGTGSPATSNTVVMTVNDPLPVSVTIVADNNPACEGSLVTFTATPVNGGLTPTYQWKVNGTNTGTNSPVLGYFPQNGDVFTCVMTSSLSCISGSPATSNAITMNITPLQLPAVTILESANDVCDQTLITFTATPVFGGQNPSYQWKVNGVNAGVNSPTFTYPPVNGDMVTCVMTSDYPCPTVNPVTSNTITMITRPLSPVSITIFESANYICEGSLITFTALPVNEGSAPIYQWKVNGQNAGADSPYFDYTPANNDVITCVLTSNIDCPSGNPATSNPVNMTVYPNLPVSVSIVASANPVCFGDQVTFTATPVNGGQTPHYQWKVNNVNAGTNTPTFTFTPANNDVVKCILTSSENCTQENPVTSNTIKITVNSSLPVSVSIVASSNPVCEGAQVTFTATPVNGGATPSYQWKVNGVNTGLNLPTYSYVPADGDQVVCVLTSSLTCVTGNPATSNTITMSVTAAVPVSVTIVASANPVCEGTPVTFTATPVNGGAAPSYQWKVNGVNAGTNTPTYTYVPVNGDHVTCVLTSSLTCVTGNPATSNTIDMSVTPLLPVSVSIVASANQVCAGTLVTFTATPVNGGTTPAYQWKVNGLAVGTNTPTYTYVPVDGDLVTCELTSSLTCVTDNPATSNTIVMSVTAVLPVSVSIVASANPVCEGTPVTFTATPVNGGVTPSYQWKVNGVNAGTDNGVYTYTPANGDLVSCVLTSNLPCVSGNPATSNVVTMTVDPKLPVSVTIVASANPVCIGTLVTFTATPVNGGPLPSYHWTVNGNTIDVDAPIYTYMPANGDQVVCVLTSSLTCVSGNPATSNTISMVVNPLPVVWMSGANNVVVGDAGLVYATEQGQLNYVWTISGGGTITSGGTTTDNTATVTWGVEGAQWIAVNFTDPQTGCTALQPMTLPVTVSPALFVQVTSPDGGEDWKQGSVHPITWNDNFDVPVRIELYKGGVFHSVIIASTPSTGSWSWTIPAGMETGTDYKVKISRFGDPSVHDFSNADFTISSSIPVNLVVQNVVIGAGQVVCYDALQTITVAGSGTTFVVENNGSATFIAGQNIIYLPGAKVEEGGYMLGKITTTNQFCGSVIIPAMVSTGTEDPTPALESTLFRLWPNPTRSTFTLEQSGTRIYDVLKVEIYNMMGERILTNEIIGQKKHEFLLSSMPVGVYFVRISGGDQVETIKLIKQ